MSWPVITREIAAAAVARVWAREFPSAALFPVSAADTVELARPPSHRVLARSVYDEEFGRARSAGVDVELAARAAAAEVRLRLRHLRPDERPAPTRSRRDGELPHAGTYLVYDAARDAYVRTDLFRPESAGIATASIYAAARENEHKRFAEAEADYEKQVEEETGVGVSPEEWERQKMDRAELLRQSHLIAAKLESAGTIAYRDDEYQLMIWHVMSQSAEQMPSFRRICFLPYIAAMVRASKLAALEYFLERHPFCRFWTFTSGGRVGLPDLRERCESLHARLNALNKELRRRFRVELVFRSTELGTVETLESVGIAKARRAAVAAHKAACREARRVGKPLPVFTRAKANQHEDTAGGIERGDGGDPLFHPHAHCVFMSLRGYIPETEWAEVISFVWSHWGDHWDAGKLVGDAREVCKYVTKPGDMAGLEPVQLAGLEAALHGLHLVQPLGTLRREISARKKAGKTLRRVRTPDGMVWRESFDHNKELSKSEELKAAMRKEQRLRDVAKMNCGLSYSALGVARPSSAQICRVVSRLAPAAGPTPMKEPRVIVMCSRGGFSESAVRNHPLVVKLWNQAIQPWTAGRLIRVHTGTSTGEQRTLTLLNDTDERFAPASGSVWEASTPCSPAYLD